MRCRKRNCDFPNVPDDIHQKWMIVIWLTTNKIIQLKLFCWRTSAHKFRCANRKLILSIYGVGTYFMQPENCSIEFSDSYRVLCDPTEMSAKTLNCWMVVCVWVLALKCVIHELLHCLYFFRRNISLESTVTEMQFLYWVIQYQGRNIYTVNDNNIE